MRLVPAVLAALGGPRIVCMRLLAAQVQPRRGCDEVIVVKVAVVVIVLLRQRGRRRLPAPAARPLLLLAVLLQQHRAAVIQQRRDQVIATQMCKPGRGALPLPREITSSGMHGMLLTG